MANQERCAELWRYITDHPEEHDQATWDCGTTACIAGHALRMFAEQDGFELRFYQNQAPYRGTYARDGDYLETAEVAADVLGLGAREASSVFYEDDRDRALDKLAYLAKGQTIEDYNNDTWGNSAGCCDCGECRPEED